MSVPIDEDVADGGEQARDILTGWLNDYSEGRCRLQDMQASFLSACRSDPDAPWHALALLDQYRRRGRIDAELARSLKRQVEKIVFGSAVRPDNAPVAADESRPAAREAEPGPAQPAREAQDSTSDLAPQEPHEEAPHDQDAHDSDAHEEQSTRWRKLSPERDLHTTRPGTAFVDRTSLRGGYAPIIAERSPAVPDEIPITHARRVLRDRYELLSVLGRGASGTVYRALDHRRTHLPANERCVAVKVFDRERRDRGVSLEELERAFHRAQSLAHPNIVKVFDLDRDGDTWFVVMELLEGRLLSDLLAALGGRAMARSHACAIISAVGAALAYAQGRGVVHADLEPRNIMITHDGDVRVLDFGFGRHRALELHTASLDGEPSPAPRYASLERLNGSEPEPADDVFSFACLAYELLSGSHPFDGGSALLARANGRRPAHVRGLDRGQVQALRRALSWTRGERRIGVAELRDALLSGERVAEHPRPDEIVAREEPGPRWRRTATLLLFLVAAAGTAVYFSAPELALRKAAYLMHAIAPGAPAGAQLESGTEDSGAGAPAADVKPEEAAGDAELQAPTEPDRNGPDGSAAAAPAQTQQHSIARESAAISRSAPSRGGPGQPSSAASSPPRLEFDQESYTVGESDGAVRLRVRRTGDASKPVSFGWSLRSNSALAGSDFAAIGPGREQMPAGVRQLTITIPIVSDAIAESTELFLVELRALQGDVELGERAHATVIIVDDD